MIVATDHKFCFIFPANMIFVGFFDQRNSIKSSISILLALKESLWQA